MKRALLTTAVAALIGAASAQAHFGNIWFDTKVGTQKTVAAAYWAKHVNCFVDPTAHSIAGSNAFQPRLYDHFVCALHSTWSGRVCLARVHVVGEAWNAVVLTGYRYKGCGPQDLRRRAAG